jgi:hypothetical protein
MGLADALKTAPKGREYKKPAIDVVLAQLDEEDRDALLNALADRDNITATTIASHLVAHGHLTGISDPAQAVRTWRNRNL